MQRDRSTARRQTSPARILGVTALLAIGSGASAFAARIEVTSRLDGTAGPSGQGGCTLRFAIVSANTDSAVNGCPAGSGADTIEVGKDDRAYGGSGQDRFLFGAFSLDNTADIVDMGIVALIKDFSHDDGDLIGLKGIPDDLNDITAYTYTFIGQDKFTGTAGEAERALVQDRLDSRDVPLDARELRRVGRTLGSAGDLDLDELVA